LDRVDDKLDIREMFYDVIASYTLVNEKNIIRELGDKDVIDNLASPDVIFLETSCDKVYYEEYELRERDECIFCSNLENFEDLDSRINSINIVQEYSKNFVFDSDHYISPRETHPFDTSVGLVGGSGRRGRSGRKPKNVRLKPKQSADIVTCIPYPYDHRNSKIYSLDVWEGTKELCRERPPIHTQGYRRYASENAIKKEFYYSDEIRLRSVYDSFCVYDFNITNLFQFDAQIVGSGVANCYGAMHKHSKYRIGDINLKFNFTLHNFTGDSPIYGFYHGNIKRPSELFKDVDGVGNILRSSAGYGPFVPTVSRPRCKQSCVFSADSVKNSYDCTNDDDIGMFGIPPIDKWLSFLFCNRSGGTDVGSYSGVLSVEFVISVYIFPSFVGDLIDITMNRYRDLEGLLVHFGPEENILKNKPSRRDFTYVIKKHDEDGFKEVGYEVEDKQLNLEEDQERQEAEQKRQEVEQVCNGQLIVGLKNENCRRRLSTELVESESVCETPSKKTSLDLFDNVWLVQDKIVSLDLVELIKCDDKNQIGDFNSEFLTELCCDDVDIILDNVFKVRNE